MYRRWRQTIASIISGSGAEATEELITSYTNTIADIAIAGDKSQYQQYIAQMMESGMSRQQAKEQANYQFFFLQPMQDAAAGALSGFAFNTGAAAMGDVNTRMYGGQFEVADVVANAQATGSPDIIVAADALGRKAASGSKVNSFDLGALQLEVDYYNALNDMQKLAYDLEPAVVDGTASLAEQMAYKIATGEKLTIAEMNRLDRDHDAIVQLGKMLGTRVANLNYTELAATLNSTATKNTISNANLSQLQEQYQQQVEQIEAAREKQSEVENQQQQEQAAQGEDTKTQTENTVDISMVQVTPLKNSIDTGIMYIERAMANGLRHTPNHILTSEEIQNLMDDITKIGADPKCFRFNTGGRTGFNEVENIINVRGDVLPDPYGVTARDIMSSRAVLAHEYYGHYMFSPSQFSVGDWRDEMRASYMAALKSPGLNREERAQLMIDAYDRAREAGYNIRYSSKAKEIIYGY